VANGAAIKAESSKLGLDQICGYFLYHANDVRVAREAGKSAVTIPLYSEIEMEAFEQAYEVLVFTRDNQDAIKRAYVEKRSGGRR